MKTRRLVRGAIAAVTAFVCSAMLRAQVPNLSNLSTRAQIGTGGNILITGLTIGGGGNKTVLLRAAGPTIGAAPFNVPGALQDPRIEVFRGSTKIAENDNWGTPVGNATPITATTFSSVGAFAFAAGSRDAALLVDLAPGGYTVQVSGVNNSTGVAIIEAYEFGPGAGKLINLSTRAQVGTGSNILIPGIVMSPGTGTRRLLIRAVGPGLSALGVGGTLGDPQITVRNAAGTPAFTIANDNWGTQLDDTIPLEVLSAAFTQAGAFALSATSRDSAVMVDLPAGSYTIQASGVGNTTGVALVEVYDLTPATPAVVSIVASKPASDESGLNPGEFTVSRTGDTLSPLTVRYSIGGSAINGFDYPALLGTVTIPAGADSVKIPLVPNPDVQNEATDTVVLTVTTGVGYTIGAQNSATVTIADSPATLYIATLRPESTATSSNTSGTATVLLSASGTLASINVSFSNLSSSQVSAHLRINPSGDYVANLPLGQVTGSQWTFTAVGPYSSADLVNALKSGNIYVGLDTMNYPQGEVRGTFIQAAGSRAFTTPAAPPSVPLTNITATDAARLLTQATFGPTKAEIDALTGGSVDDWITIQMAKPATSHRSAIQSDRNTFGGSNSYTNWNAIHPPNRQSAWFKVALTGDDQLRQRVAFALSQIFVVSDQSLGDDSRAEPLANYYDMLVNGAFGNFRTLLENVTLSPIMGEYLSSLRNSKATFDAQGNVLTTPDENYAREVMQLFTIGLVLLQPDGTLALGSDNLPLPTYNQATITEMARVFTGWAYPSTNLNNFRTAGANYISPMQLFPAFHDDNAKNLSPVLVTPLPAGQGGLKDLQVALDALFTHPNTAPFISKLLIQRLVTSNPTAGYVYRVAQKFENNGAGVRGDLGAVVRAILTDYEARSPDIAARPSFGKLKEPLLRLTGLLRGFGATASSGRYLGYRHTLVDGTFITGTTPLPAVADRLPNTSGSPTVSSSTVVNNALGSMAQAPLRSPTVFNFFHADYVLPGPLAAAGLVVPEFEITDDNFAINVPNYLRTFVIATVPNTAAGPYTLTLNTTAEQALVSNPAALLDRLSLVLTANNLPANTRSRIMSALAALPASTSALDRVNTAILLALTSPSAAVQK